MDISILIKSGSYENPGISLPTDLSFDGYIKVLLNYMYWTIFGTVLKLFPYL